MLLKKLKEYFLKINEFISSLVKDFSFNFYYKVFIEFSSKNFSNFFELVLDFYEVFKKHHKLIIKILLWYFFIVFVFYSITYAFIFLGFEYSNETLLTFGAYLLKLYNLWTFPVSRIRVRMHATFRSFYTFIFKILKALFARGPSAECMGNGKDDSKKDQSIRNLLFSPMPQPPFKFVGATENSLNCSTRMAMLSLHSTWGLGGALRNSAHATSTAMDYGMDPREVRNQGIKDYLDFKQQIYDNYPCYDEKTLHDINNKR